MDRVFIDIFTGAIIYPQTEKNLTAMEQVPHRYVEWMAYI